MKDSRRSFRFIILCKLSSGRGSDSAVAELFGRTLHRSLGSHPPLSSLQSAQTLESELAVPKLSVARKESVSSLTRFATESEPKSAQEHLRSILPLLLLQTLFF